ncbi:hypothetical protein D9M68_577910 [compost metagenome]
MIEKIANNESNQEILNLNPIEDIVEKLNYYRSLFGKVHDLTDEQFDNLKSDIANFFNIKIGGSTQDAPKRLVRISNNTNILKSQGLELSCLNHISQLLAPPINYCGFGRCNIPGQQVLYCAITESGAYWETRPKKGEVITLSYYELKPNAKINCLVIMKEKTANPKIEHKLQELYYVLEDFFVDAYSLEIDRSRPRDYIFSALLSSEQLFYPVVSEDHFEAIIYPSVQKKKYGENFAIRNELILEKYNLIGVETRFILEEYVDVDPATDINTSDHLISSIVTNKFDFDKGEILYSSNVDEAFKIFRMIQMSTGKQIRYEIPGIPDTLHFNLSQNIQGLPIENKKAQKPSRNQIVNVVYIDGSRIDNIKYKKVEKDILKGKCQITKY